MATPQSPNAGKPSANPSGPFNPTPHVHPAGYLPRQEPLYDAIDVYINNQLAALYNAASPSKFVGAPESVLGSLTPEIAAPTKSGAAAKAEQDAGVAGNGDFAPVGPNGGPVKSTTADPQAGVTTDTGTGIAQLDPNVDPNTIFVILGKLLNGVLAEAADGSWRRTGSNPKIVSCFQSVGYNCGGSDSPPWCAAFAGAMLKKAGVAALQTASSQAYANWGQAVDLQDRSKWRLNDLIVFNRGPGVGHVGFFRGYNQSNGAVLILGGNQGSNVTESPFAAGYMPIVAVRRNWTVPETYDKVVTYTGSSTKNINVV